ncbi:membrane frizzled-related protein-like [Amphiura filiformis]|uniref:membrane frizzled-related protein-like n=1 Tax=Amphiura filiformis TaxID=82378 RepID=UPI003B220341
MAGEGKGNARGSCYDGGLICIPGRQCSNSSNECDGLPACFDGSDEFNCHGCSRDAQFVQMELDEVQYITSPNYPVSYPSNLNCIWLIFGTDDNEGIFTVRFLQFETEVNFDVLAIGIGNDSTENRIQEFHDFHFVNSISLNVSSFWISFTTDSRVTASGFVVTIERRTSSVSCLTEEFQCMSWQVCLDHSFVCDLFPHCPDESDETQCGKHMVLIFNVLCTRIFSASSSAGWSQGDFPKVSLKVQSIIFNPGK